MGCTEAEKSDRLLWGLQGHADHPWKGILCLHLLAYLPGPRQATSGGGVFIIAHSSACQRSASGRVNTGLANGCRQALREPLGERESQCAHGPAVLHRLVAPCVSTAPACVCSLHPRILLRPPSRPAALGQANKAFFSPRCVHTRDQAEACLREKGICEQPSRCWCLLGTESLLRWNHPLVGGTQVCPPLGFRSV